MQLDITYNEDCLIGLYKIPDESIDMIFSDLPYGTTKNHWDKKIPLYDYILLDENIKKDFNLTQYKYNHFNKPYMYEAEYILFQCQRGMSYIEAKMNFNKHKNLGLWTHFERIIKPHGVIALWAQPPFSHELAMSNSHFRYEWIIEKTKGTGHQNAKKMPMKCHESVLIFYKHLPIYNPQKTTGHPPVHKFTKHTENGTNYGKSKTGISGGGSTERYPRDVLKFKWDTQKSKLHPTQKPLEACKYFIKTYTNENDIILDATAGSFTTALAARDLNRHYICFEKDSTIYEIGVSRLKKENITV